MHLGALARAVPSAVVATLVLAPSLVLAHAELIDSVPADGATLERPPTEVVLSFGGELDPDGSRFTVADASGAVVGRGEVDLEVAERDVLRGPVQIEGEGTFTVSWTALSIDGHAEDGTLTFTVGNEADAPDTATAPPPPAGPIGLGAMLLAVAVLAAAAAVRHGVSDR